MGKWKHVGGQLTPAGGGKVGQERLPRGSDKKTLMQRQVDLRPAKKRAMRVGGAVMLGEETVSSTA